MPLEIKEIVITATVGESNSGSIDDNGGSNDEKQEIIAQCVEQVLEILKEKMER